MRLTIRTLKSFLYQHVHVSMLREKKNKREVDMHVLQSVTCINSYVAFNTFTLDELRTTYTYIRINNN